MNGHKEGSIERFLRPISETITRSAYACEVNPWVTKSEIEAAMLFRGAIVSAYGYIETSLGELCLRASRLEEYADLRQTFPFSTEKRVSFLRKAFSTGPLEPYKRTAHLFLDKFQNNDRLRNLVAHAKMQVMNESGATFIDFPTGNANGIILYRTPMSLQELERLAWKSSLRSRLCQHLCDLLDREDVLPSLQT